MKVFAYNIETGVRGELLDEIHCVGYGSYGFTLPKVKIVNSSNKWNKCNFTVTAYVETKSGRIVTAKDFGRNAVIFCEGQRTTGTDTAWEWVILVTPLEG